MQITIDTPPLGSIADHRAALVALDGQLQPAWQYRARLAALASAPGRIDEIAAGVLEATGRERGAPWVQPEGAHDAYPPGSIVEGNAGECHRATAWASHAPGTTGAPWERVWANGNGWTTTPPAAAGPLAWAVGISAVGPADPGGKPQTVVSHKGRLWRCKVTHVTHAGWVPSAATHAVWTDIGPA